MTLVDPKLGVAYAFGERLTSAAVNTVWSQQPRALDAVSGGSYTLAAALTLAGSATVHAGWTKVNIPSGCDWTWLGTTTLPKLGSRSYVRVQPLILQHTTSFGGTPDWVFSNAAPVTGGSLIQQYVDATGANDPAFYMPLTNLIDLSTLEAVAVQLLPTSPTPPAEPPKIQVYKVTLSGSATVGSETTDGTSGAGYGAAHQFSVSSLAESIDMSATPTLYIARIKGESGSGSNTGLQIRTVFTVHTVTQLTPGG